LLPKCGVTILNGLSVSSSEKEFDNGIKSWKIHIYTSAEWHKAFGGHQFSNEGRIATRHLDLEFDNFKWHWNPKHNIIKCNSWLYGWFFQRWWSDILKEEVNTFLMA
jgi:hypothetical protein